MTSTGRPDAAVQEAEASSPIDALPLSLYQLAALVMAGMTVVLDGIDNQILGLAAPSLIKEWGISRATLGDVFALGFVGMVFGTMLTGWIGDRYGRRAALMIGVGLFAIATLLTGFADNVMAVAALRALAGLGLGGVPSTAAALISECAPTRFRSLAVTAGVVCMSFGGILGGVMAAFVLPTLGWRSLFYIGGTVPLLTMIALHLWLPESPRFLARRPDRHPELIAFLRRVGHPDPAGAAITPISERQAAYVPIRALFADGLARDSVALSVAMLVGMMFIYLVYNWAPTLLFGSGFSLAVASTGSTAFNLGGVVGALIAAVGFARFGSRPVLVPLLVGATVICVGLAMLPIDQGRNQPALLGALFALGVTGNAAMAALFSVGTHAFPTALRARGMGMVGGAGKVGALLSAFFGATLVAGGASLYFGAFAALMLVTAIALALVKRHIPGAVAVSSETIERSVPA